MSLFQLRKVISALILRLAGAQSSMTGSRLTLGLSVKRTPILDIRSQLKLTSSSPIPQFQVSSPLSANWTVPFQHQNEGLGCIHVLLLQ